jgi:phosphatidylserine/phosphatidylglycerophosphate/cardiolipin synthase-like enzyme
MPGTSRPNRLPTAVSTTKVAVADGSICFITSANLTGYAMEKNMEMGVLIEVGNS